MKKIFLIIILLIICLFIFISTSEPVNLEKIDLNLEYDELGILFLNLNNSNSLILSLNDINILYIIDYEDDKEIKKELDNLNMKLDYIVMNNNYDIDLGVSKQIINKKLIINNIIFNNSYQSINYNNQSLCINNVNCDYIYYTKKDIKVNDNKVLFFNQKLKLPDNLYKEWVDIYKINKSIYTILKIKDSYKVIEIIKNI